LKNITNKLFETF